jgi:hypothetical protein
MSAIQMLIANIQALSPQDRSAVFTAFGFDSAKAKAVKAEKKPRANAGRGTAWSAFTLKIQQEHKEEMDALKVEAAAKRKAAKDAGLPVPEDTKGAHLHWCSAYKTAHEDEWKAFKATWELEHPKVTTGAESSDDAATVVDEASAPPAAVGGGGSSAAAEVSAKKRGPKKMADMTPEEQAAAKAKRAAKKAEKASATNSADVSRAPSPPKAKSE